MRGLIAVLLLGVTLDIGTSSAQADTIFGHVGPDASFNAYSVPNSGGFGGGFAKGFNNSRAAAPDSGTALGSWLPGVIIGTDRQLQFEVQVSMHGGGARAFDPVSRERFSGVYTVKADGFFSADTTVSLVGDHGSLLSCGVQMHRGNPPTGNGDCIDRKQEHYQLQF